MSASQMLQNAIGLHQSGQLGPARSIYQEILNLEPDHAEAHHFLGMLEHQAGNGPLGLRHLRQSVTLKPNQAFFYNNLGNTLKDMGEVDEAIQAYRKGIELDSSFVIARYNLAKLFGNAQQFPEAIKELEAAVRIQPGFAEAWTSLGQYQNSLGDHQAKQSFQEAIKARPQDPEVWFHLSEIHNSLKEWDLSCKALTRALELRPVFPEALNNLGLVFKELGQLEQARNCFQQTIQWAPGFLDPLNNLGTLAREKGFKEESFHLHHKALSLNPNDAQSHFCFANLMVDLGKLELAVDHFQNALRIRPDFPQALNNMGNVLMSLKRNQEAREVFQNAIAAKPDFYEAYANFGNLDKEAGFPDLAEKSMLEAIRLKPDFAAAHSNLGNAYFDQGKFEKALESYRKGIELGQDDGDFVSNYLFCLNYGPDFTEEWVTSEHLRLCREKFGHLKSVTPYPNDPVPDKKLRIGYVSPDFGAHPVARFMHPILKNHDRSKVEVFVYSLRYLKDPVTHACQSLVENWRDAYGQNDEELANTIRQDKIDILVDLIMHARDCRPRLFARKPAPIQITYLAYPGTTGLETIDYRITDSHLDPLEKGKGLFPETPLRLPHSWWCYCPPIEVAVPDAVPPPFLSNGFVTFGSLNNFVKVHPQTQELWAEILNQVPDSRLHIHIKEGRHRQAVREFFQSKGISEQRLKMVGYQPTTDYFRSYNEIDIALDPFPFAGGTTTCDALWMGVPVITLAGERTVSRGGVSILNTLRIPEWIAKSKDDYVTKAIRLSEAKEELQTYRKKLRQKMLDSPLMDGTGFTTALETLYLNVWSDWCLKR